MFDCYSVDCFACLNQYCSNEIVNTMTRLKNENKSLKKTIEHLNKDKQKFNELCADTIKKGPHSDNTIFNNIFEIIERVV